MHLFNKTSCIPEEVVFLLPTNGSTSNFKAYYLRFTFQQLIDKTNSEEKHFIKDFWNNYNIIDNEDNINLQDREMHERSIEEYVTGAKQGY